MENNIPAGLILETDINTIRLFPAIDKKDSCPDYIAREEQFQDLLDLDAQLEKSSRSKCTWGVGRIKRFITRYVSIYKKRNLPDREFFLEQLESIAKENNVVLPTEDKIKAVCSERQKTSLIVDIVSLNSENKVSEFKYYFDGSNVVAYIPGENNCIEREIHKRSKWDDLFDSLYPVIKSQYSEKNKTAEEKNKIRLKIESELINQYYNLYCYDDRIEDETCPEFIERKLYNMSAAYSERKKRFHRKKDQVRWTAWWTITYDDNIFDSEYRFRRVLLNKFKNLAVRKHWLIMGVFEHGEDNGRLHFHGFFYIPDGQEVGELVEVERYSYKRRCIERYIENTEFRKLFGINQYEDISEAMRSDINAMATYTSKMLRYMDKGEKVFYSRHIPMEFLGEFRAHDMLIAFCITCKRPIKRYVINPHILVRTDTAIARKFPIITRDERTDPYEIGLLSTV